MPNNINTSMLYLLQAHVLVLHYSIVSAMVLGCRGDRAYIGQRSMPKMFPIITQDHWPYTESRQGEKTICFASNYSK